MGYYNENDWQNLSYDQRTQVLEARGAKRNVSTVGTVVTQQGSTVAHDDGVSAITGVVTVPQQPGNNSTNGGNAGSQFGRRRIGAINSGLRQTLVPNANSTQIASMIATTVNLSIDYSSLELDSHADTACVGPECSILSVTEKVCRVNAYHPRYNAFEDIPVVQAATAHDDPETGITYILVINQALQIPGMGVTLLNPNQLRANGIIINDIPIHLSPDPANASHSIVVPDENLTIPLKLQGVISKVEVRLPTIQEIETCKWIILTSDAGWEPNSPEFMEAEEACINANNSIQPERPRELCNIQVEVLHQNNIHGQNILERMCGGVCVSAVGTKGRTYNDALRNKIAKTFGIGIRTANDNLRATTQLAIRHTLHPIH